jgi:hypothetical protein
MNSSEERKFIFRHMIVHTIIVIVWIVAVVYSAFSLPAHTGYVAEGVRVTIFIVVMMCHIVAIVLPTSSYPSSRTLSS